LLGYSIRDLETTDLVNEVADWTFSSGTSKTYTTTAYQDVPSAVILGGPNKLAPGGSAAGAYIQRTYSNIVTPHSYVAITFVLWYFDDWSPQDGLSAVRWEIDGNVMDGPKIDYTNDFLSQEGGNTTGPNSKDCGWVHIKTGRAHSTDTLTFKIYGLLTGEAQNTRFGIRDISFVFNDLVSPLFTTCQVSGEIQLYGTGNLMYNTCACDIDEGLNLAGTTCVACASKCAYCFGEDIDQCLQCDDELAYTGTDCCHKFCSACTGATQYTCTACYDDYYNYGNNTCSDQCLSPFKISTVSSELMCDKPCDTGKFYYAYNDSCFDDCDAPLEQYTNGTNLIDYCANPCSPISKFLYPNGTCADTCPLPLANRSDPGIKHCYNPCTDPDNEYLYANGTCLLNCDSPYVIRANPDVMYCENPCNTTEYLFTNETCLDDCPLPLSTLINPGVQFCYNPCTDPDNEYLYANGTCFSNCDPPYVIRVEPDVMYCENPCNPTTEFLFTNGTCLDDCPLPLYTLINPGVQFCYNPCTDPDNEYLYANSSCLLTCDLPLVIRADPDVMYCENPCNPTTEFLFINGTCLTSCPTPLYTLIEPGTQFCYNPCSATEQYLYYDGTCMNNCLSPLIIKIDPEVQYCLPKCGSPLTQYIFSNGSCIDSCPSPLASQIESGAQYCFNPCPLPTKQFLYVNGSCISTCPTPLVSRSEPGVKYCYNPCPSPTTQYLYWNETCSTDCVSPLVSRSEPDVMYCFNPCSSSSLFLYVNGSCFSTCPLPLFNRSEPGVKYCFNPCDPSTQYLFSNGSCVNSCPSPLASRSEPGVKYCWNPCPEAKFLFPNQSCLTTCPYPLTSRTEPGVQFCYNSCPSPSTYYLYWNQTCGLTCNDPLVIKNEPAAMYCINPCPTDTVYLYGNLSCLSTCPLPLVSKEEPGVKFCLNPCATTDFLYWNQSCASTCYSPLSSKSEPGVKYCYNPCSDPVNSYLYTNKSCLTTCPYPLAYRNEPGVKFCYNPCANPTTEYLYWNQTCIVTCISPLIKKTEPGTMYCLNPCPNPSTQYLYPNETCSTKCNAPLEYRNEPGINYCYNPCPDPVNDYLYMNESCLTSCPTPLLSRTEPGTLYCYNPCSPTQYLFINSTCSNNCPDGLISRVEPDVQYCFTPCPDVSLYLYLNGSCLIDCPSPLWSRVEPAGRFCTNPCQGTSKYLYPNGTCISTCPSPLLHRSEPDVDYCFLPCTAPNIYWYINASCLAVCQSPMLQITYNGVIMCLSPCSNPSYYYYTYEKTCYPACESPYTASMVDKLKVCKFSVDIDLETVNELKDAADSIANQASYASGGMKAASALNSGSPGSALLAGLSSMLQYIRYMQINYPPKVETLFLVSADAPISISFDFSIPPEIDKQLADYPLPYNFDKYEIDSNFVRNMWDMIGSFLASVFFIFGLMIVIKLVRKLPKIQNIFQKVLRVAKWNIPAMMLCSSSGDIFFYASLHMMVMKLNSFFAVACFLVAIFMIIATLYLWYLTIKIVMDFKKVKELPQPVSLEESGFKEKWEDYELLYGESEENSILTMAYMTFFIARGLTFNLTIACLYEYPLVQVAIINGSNFLMFGYLIVYRPLKEFIGLVQVFVNEALVIILSVSTLILAIMDQMGIVGTSTRASVGEAILFVIKTFNTIGLAFMGIQFLMMLIFAYRAIKYFRAKGIKNPLKMIQVIAFEEFEEKKEEEGSDTPKKGSREKKIRIIRPPRKLFDSEMNRTNSVLMITDPGVPSINVFGSSPQSRINSKRGVKPFPSKNFLNVLETSKTPLSNSLDHSTIENESSQLIILENKAEIATPKSDKEIEMVMKESLKMDTSAVENNSHNELSSKMDTLSPFSAVENPNNGLLNPYTKSLRRLRNKARSPSQVSSAVSQVDRSLELVPQKSAEELNLRSSLGEKLEKKSSDIEQELSENLCVSRTLSQVRSDFGENLSQGKSDNAENLDKEVEDLPELEHQTSEMLNLSQMTEGNLVMETIQQETEESPPKMKDASDIIHSLRKMKERRNRLKKEDDPNKSWFSSLRKVKDYLRNKNKEE